MEAKAIAPSRDERSSTNVDAVSVRVVWSGRDSEKDPRREIPELGFTDYWYPLVSARRLRRRRPISVRVLGRDLCVFMGEHGPAALEDACPHRGTRLSGGNCHYRGTVSCPYHGWTFDETGTCVAALSEGPESRMPGKVGARSYPTVTLKGIVFAWIGDSEATDPRVDLPPELFDDSLVLHDYTIWKANWRPALENFQDNHAPYVHRNSIRMLMRPFGKTSYAGARAIIDGGGVHLSHYQDGTAGDRPYREWFAGVNGTWPKHRYRLMWAWAFKSPLLRWLSPKGGVDNERAAPYHADPEWNNGPHMPGMQRILERDWHGSFLYTRWCVPIDAGTTREFYFHACRRGRFGRIAERLKYPLVNRLLYYRNFGLQDGRVLEATPYDRPERFSHFDAETIGWRRLAMLSARYGGRHDRIPPEVISKLNGTSAERNAHV